MRKTIEFPRRQSAGLHHLVVGDAFVTAVNDGTFQASFDLIVGIDHSECERLETAAFRPVPPKMTMNAFLVQIAGRRMLVDTGCGVSMGPTLGMLSDNLRSMGVEPDDIDTVLMTHLHPDHVNGLIDAHGQAVFPKAELVVNEAELNFFRDPDSPGRSPPETLEFFEGARLAAAPYADRIRTIRDGPVFPGVSAVTQAGHTPGQTAWLIESGSEFRHDLGRRGAYAEPADGGAPGRDRARHRPRAGDRDAETRPGHGCDGPHPCRWHAFRLPGYRPYRAPGNGLRVCAGGVAGFCLSNAGALRSAPVYLWVDAGHKKITREDEQ